MHVSSEKEGKATRPGDDQCIETREPGRRGESTEIATLLESKQGISMRSEREDDAYDVLVRKTGSTPCAMRNDSVGARRQVRQMIHANGAELTDRREKKSPR